jgi:hypothetical protein
LKELLVPMPTTPFFAGRRFLWFGIAVVLAVVGALGGRAVVRIKTNKAPVAAYLIPIDKSSRIKPAWWHTISINIPWTLRSDERIMIPAGASVKLIHADSGVAELVAGPTKLFFQQKLPSETNTLVSPLPEMIAEATKTERSDHTVIITSPFGMTRYLNPLIAWTTREGVTYDVAVLDPADTFVPPRIARGIRPPIALADLATPQRRQLGVDRNYEIIVREAGALAIAGGARFLTATDATLENQIPTAPAELIAEAASAMAKAPRRTGDAWIALSRLPADWAHSELAVRLRLRVAAELGLAEELDQAQADARLVLKH